MDKRGFDHHLLSDINLYFSNLDSHINVCLFINMNCVLSTYILCYDMVVIIIGYINIFYKNNTGNQ